jgi:hypothetical protein
MSTWPSDLDIISNCPGTEHDRLERWQNSQRNYSYFSDPSDIAVPDSILANNTRPPRPQRRITSSRQQNNAQVKSIFQLHFQTFYPEFPPFSLGCRGREFYWTCYPRYLGITRRSCLEAHMVLDMEYREQERPEHGPGGPFFFFSSRFVLPAVPASITTGLGLHQRRLLLHEVIGPRYHGMCHIWSL